MGRATGMGLERIEMGFGRWLNGAGHFNVARGALTKVPTCLKVIAKPSRRTAKIKRVSSVRFTSRLVLTRRFLVFGESFKNEKKPAFFFFCRVRAITEHHKVTSDK